MLRTNLSVPIAALVCLAMALVARGATSDRVIIYDGKATQVGPSPNQSPDLWITTRDLEKATRFEIKPQGVCRDDLCFPIPKNRKDAFVRKIGTATWFNMTEFAKLLRQPVATDDKHQVWFFGPRQSAQDSFVDTLDAPNFTLPDMNGKMHSLSDFRGKKVLLVTWASW